MTLVDVLEEMDYKHLIKEDKVTLYHRSSNKNLDVVDPGEAIRNMNLHSKQEFLVWSRPRVFFFTHPEQKDISCGLFDNSVYYAEFPACQLYPILEDPFNLRSKSAKERYFELIKPHTTFVHNLYEQIAVLAELEHGCVGFIYRQSPNPDSLIATIWKRVPVKPLLSEKIM